MNAIMNLLVDEDLFASQEGHCSVELVPLYTGSFVSS